MLFSLVFANNPILLCLLFFFSIIEFLIHAIIAQIFISTAELITRIGTSTRESKAEIETHPLIAEAKISKCSI